MQISLGQLDTAARTCVRWTRFHSGPRGFRAPEVNTGGGRGLEGGETLARTHAGVHQRDKHRSGNDVPVIPMKRGGWSDHRRETNCCCSTSSCSPGGRDELNVAAAAASRFPGRPLRHHHHHHRHRRPSGHTAALNAAAVKLQLIKIM